MKMITKQNRWITALIVIASIAILAAIAIPTVLLSGNAASAVSTAAPLTGAEAEKIVCEAAGITDPALCAEHIRKVASLNVLATPTVVDPNAQRVPATNLVPVGTPIIPDQGGSRQHIVVSGDTLGVIAAQYSVTVDGIKALNGLTSDLIYVGDTLSIPESSSTFSGQQSFVPTGSQLPVLDTILGPIGYAKTAMDTNLAWPGTWNEKARPKFENINGVQVWREQAVLPGEYVLYVGDGIWTPKGFYEGCSGGWFVNDTQLTINVQIKSMSELVVGTSNNYDAMARELSKRTSSGNQCAAAYLGQIPLH